MLSVKSQFSGTCVNLRCGLGVNPMVSDQRALLTPQNGPAEWPHLSIINRWSSQSPHPLSDTNASLMRASAESEGSRIREKPVSTSFWRATETRHTVSRSKIESNRLCFHHGYINRTGRSRDATGRLGRLPAQQAQANCYCPQAWP